MHVYIYDLFLRRWNVGEPLKVAWQTNNRAEYSAALAALRRANLEDPGCAKPLYVFTDSNLLIHRWD